MKQMCKKKIQSPCVCRNELSNPRFLTSFTDYSKTTRVRKFYTVYTGVIEANYIWWLIVYPIVYISNVSFTFSYKKVYVEVFEQEDSANWLPGNENIRHW